MIKSYVFRALVALLFVAPFAQAQAAPVGTCSIQANLVVKSLHIVVGGTRGQGYGQITCAYVNGFVEQLPIRVTTAGVGVGFGASRTNVKMYATGIGLVNGGARALAGNYMLAQAGAQVIRIGGEFGFGLTASRNGFAIPIGVQAKTGEGIEIAANFGGMKIEPLDGLY